MLTRVSFDARLFERVAQAIKMLIGEEVQGAQDGVTQFWESSGDLESLFRT